MGHTKVQEEAVVVGTSFLTLFSFALLVHDLFSVTFHVRLERSSLFGTRSINVIGAPEIDSSLSKFTRDQGKYLYTGQIPSVLDATWWTRPSTGMAQVNCLPGWLPGQSSVWS